MAFDIIGDIAVIKPPLKMSEEEYVKYIREKHKFVKTILLQETDVLPPYRTAKYKILWGENNTETIHKEFGLRFKVDVTKTYYSPRLANERYYIARQVKDNEDVLVMFSGVNPYSIYISKFSNAKSIYSIELNPYAVKYGLENVKLNKVKNVVTILGDVRRVVPLISFFSDGDGYIHSDKDYILDVLDSKIHLKKAVLELSKDIADYYQSIYAEKKYLKYDNLSDLVWYKETYNVDGLIKEGPNEFYVLDSMSKSVYKIDKFGRKFDRIIMPLPKESEYFLDLAINVIKNNGIIHMYVFMHEDEIPEKAHEILSKYSNELGFKYEIINVRKVGDIAPRQYRVCIDFKVKFKH